MISYTVFKTPKLRAPRDDFYAALDALRLSLRDDDILVVASKVISIHEGRAVLNTGKKEKDRLAKREARRYVEVQRTATWKSLFTETEGVLIGRAGIDESNGNGFFILYPKDPMKSAARLRTHLMKKFSLSRLGVIIADSRSTPLRRGAIGFALGWAGFMPLKDYRKTRDLFGRSFEVEIANIADGISAGAVVALGEGDEQTPVVRVRGVNVVFTDRARPQEKMLKVSLEDDLFSPFLRALTWKKGGNAR